MQVSFEKQSINLENIASEFEKFVKLHWQKQMKKNVARMIFQKRSDSRGQLRLFQSPWKKKSSL